MLLSILLCEEAAMENDCNNPLEEETKADSEEIRVDEIVHHPTLGCENFIPFEEL